MQYTYCTSHQEGHCKSAKLGYPVSCRTHMPKVWESSHLANFGAATALQAQSNRNTAIEDQAPNEIAP